MKLEPAALRPERYGPGEPVRRDLHAPNGITDAVELWLNEGRGLIFKRKSRPGMVTDFLWSRIPSTKRPRFPWGCNVWLARSAGDTLAISLLCFFIDQLKPAFASITDADDYRERHERQVRVNLGSSEVSGTKYLGTAIENHLPGIYWRTYLGHGARDLLGKASAERMPPEAIVECGSHKLLAPFSASGEIGTKSALLAERDILQALGSHHFFGGLPREDGVRS